jgi:serine/threonine protein kinase
LAAGIVETNAYMAQELVTSAYSLDVYVRERGPMAPVEAVRLAGELAAALDHAAARNAVHGGIHPRDILVSGSGARLTGVGIVRALEHVNVAAPNRRPYVAPERAAGAVWDRRADIFSLAAIVFELLWGRRLIGIGEHAVRGLKPLQGANLMALQRTFGRALAGDPAARFDTAQSFADALGSSFDIQKITAEPIARTTTETPPDSASQAASSLDLTSIRPVREVRRRDEFEPSLPLDDNPPRPSDLELSGSPSRPAEPAAPIADVPLDTPNRVTNSIRDREDAGPDRVRIDRDGWRTEIPPEPSIAHVPAPPSKVPSAPVSDPMPASTLLSPQLQRMPSSVWPLAVALVIGLAVGFAAGYGVGGREWFDDGGRSGSAPRSTAESGIAQPGGVDSSAPESRTSQSGGSQSAADTATSAAGGAAASDSKTNPGSSDAAGARAAPSSRTPTATATAKTGQVIVRSTPPGARATVDGRDVGVTPLTLRDLTPGAHTIRVSLNGYGTREQRVVVDPKRPAQTIAMELVAPRAARGGEQNRAAPQPTAGAVGGLEVISRPAGATVFIDGKPVGKTPLLLQSVEPGNHGIRLEQEGYRSWVTSVRITQGERSRVAASLEP